MEFKKSLFMLMAAGSLLVAAGLNSCANNSKTDKAEADAEVAVEAEVKADSLETETSDAEMEEPTELKAHSLDEAPQSKGTLLTYLVAGYNGDGWASMFIVDGKDSRLTQTTDGEEEIIYILRLVSYEETFRNKTEDDEDYGGPLVVNAYDPKSHACVGQYKGEYSCGCAYEHGEVVNCGESFSGTFTRLDGKTEEFSFYGD